ncbi:MAG: ABC transporter substrate-binding protein [Chloroflexota bacterium]
MIAALREGIRDLGYVEGQDLLIDVHTADGDDRLAEPAAELVRLQPAVIVGPSSAVIVALRAATSTIPLVNAGVGNLLNTGFVDSLARPGGNITGLSTPLLAGRQLQLLQEAVSTLSRVAVLADASAPLGPRAAAAVEAAGHTLGLELVYLSTSGDVDLERAFETAVRERADGLFALAGPWITTNATRIAELAVRCRLPSMWQPTDAASRGGLMAYGANRPDMARRAATYVDKILKGAKPADLPIEQPTTFDLAINLRTAQALGLTFSHAILAQATEVIQ